MFAELSFLYNFTHIGEKLFIIMDLIDGAPLGEHFNSLKEKGEMFTESRLWNIFIQVSSFF